MKTAYTKGISLVEVLVASSIILIFVIALVSVYTLYKQLALSNGDAAKSAYLAEEGIEAVKLLRDQSWTTKVAPLTLGTHYYLVFQNSTWVATTTPTLIDGIDRYVVFSAVSRDGSGNIVSSGGTNDAGTRLATLTIAWSSERGTTTQSLAAYVSNIFSN